MILLRLRVYPKPFYAFKRGQMQETDRAMIPDNKKDTAATVS